MHDFFAIFAQSFEAGKFFWSEVDAVAERLLIARVEGEVGKTNAHFSSKHAFLQRSGFVIFDDYGKPAAPDFRGVGLFRTNHCREKLVVDTGPVEGFNSERIRWYFVLPKHAHDFLSSEIVDGFVFEFTTLVHPIHADLHGPLIEV